MVILKLEFEEGIEMTKYWMGDGNVAQEMEFRTQFHFQCNALITIVSPIFWNSGTFLLQRLILLPGNFLAPRCT